MNIAIIPARGGSKRIPRKNIKIFDGKPMIAYAILAAKESGLFQHIIVSTDDDEIAQMAKEWGAEIPFMRPSELSNDHATTIPVIKHAIETCNTFGWKPEHVCCIYPSVPFIRASDLQTAFDRLIKSDSDYCYPVTEFPSVVQRALKIINSGQTQPFYPQFESTRTQDLEPAYYDAGQFYWGKANAWINNTSIHNGGLGYVIPNWRVVDIDTPDDWERAELFAHTINNKILKSNF